MNSGVDEPSVELAPGRRWWEEPKHRPSRQRELIIRRPTRLFNLDVHGFEKATKVADLRRIRNARERSRARRLAV